MGKHLAGYYGPNTSRKLPTAARRGGGFLYVFAFDLEGPSKIGITIRPRTRVNELQHAAGRGLAHAYLSPECTNYEALEAELHQRCKAHGLHHMGEWFQIPFWEATKAVTLNMGHFNRVRQDRGLVRLRKAVELIKPPAAFHHTRN